MPSAHLLKLVTLLMLICSVHVNITNGAKILGIFTMPCKSQYLLGSVLLKGLAAKGHEVTLISNTCSNNSLANYEEICPESIFRLREKTNFPVLYNGSLPEFVKRLDFFINELSRGVLEDEQVQKLMKSNKKFDITIHTMMFNEALLGLSHKLNSTTVGFSPLGTNPMTNFLTSNPAPYSYVPFMFLPYSDEMSFLQRVANTLSSLLMDLILTFYYYPTQNEILKQHFPDAPELSQLIEDVDIFFLNSHYSTESPRPMQKNLIQIGGFYLEDTEVLTEDIKQFLDASNQGFIYLSFGSNYNASKWLPFEKKQSIIKALGRIDYNVIWKFEEHIADLPKNVKISKWVPQRSVLAHRNIKAFVTHSGMGSTAEAIYMGVPMVCIPLMGDQKGHAAESVEKGFGVLLEFDDLNEETLSVAINEVAKNDRYRTNVQLRSDIYRNQPIKPSDHVAYWIDHVIKHKGAKHLKSKASKIPWYQYYLLDVIAFLVALSIGFIKFSGFILRKVFSLIRSKRKLKIS